MDSMDSEELKVPTTWERDSERQTNVSELIWENGQLSTDSLYVCFLDSAAIKSIHHDEDDLTCIVLFRSQTDVAIDGLPNCNKCNTLPCLPGNLSIIIISVRPCPMDRDGDTVWFGGKWTWMGDQSDQLMRASGRQSKRIKFNISSTHGSLHLEKEWIYSRREGENGARYRSHHHKQQVRKSTKKQRIGNNFIGWLNISIIRFHEQFQGVVGTWMRSTTSTTQTTCTSYGA